VIEAGIGALKDRAGAGAELVCAVGPSAGGCCYEVDEPVRRALARRYAGWLPDVMVESRPGHALFDPGRLATRILETLVGGAPQVGTRHRVCTICDADRFESHRRDGAAAGRLRHFIGKPAT
jgi:copper oxidase (laccase) domain-containing protein